MNMTYCMFENTVKDIQQIRDEIQERGLNEIVESGSQYERQAIGDFIDLIREMEGSGELEMIEEAIENLEL